MKISNEVLNILDSSMIEDNIVYLPPQQLERNLYLAVNKCLESIGGKWNRKVKGHIFEDNPADLLDNLILTGETVDLKKEYQYFPTPKTMAQRMIILAEIKPEDIILEPSAGQGAIVDELPKENRKILIELNPKNAEVLRQKGYPVAEKDFLEFDTAIANKIIMNPPFSKQQDIDHILHAWDILLPTGIMVSVVSDGPFFRENKKSVEFRNWLDRCNAEIFDNEAGAFKESGTMVKTRIIKVCKGR